MIEIFGIGFELLEQGSKFFEQGSKFFEPGSKFRNFDLVVFGGEQVTRQAAEHITPGTSKQDTLKINFP